jgi:hypothetical protein
MNEVNVSGHYVLRNRLGRFFNKVKNSRRVPDL